MGIISDKQRYIAKELTHFVGRNLPEEEQYLLLVKILNTGWLTHHPHDPKISGAMMLRSWVSMCDNEMFLPQVICFCDIPIGDMKIHIEKYSPFGLSFPKSFLVIQGANPVYYLAKNSIIKTPSIFEEREYDQFKNEITRCEYFDIMSKEMHKVFIEIVSSLTPQNKISVPTQEFKIVFDTWIMFLNYYVFGFVKFFDDNKGDDDPEYYYMEREWRIIGNLNFELKDVYRVILPETYGKRFQQDMPDFYGQVSYVET